MSVRPLTVTEAPVPPFRVLGYRTVGTFPQLKGDGVNLQAVNDALRELVLRHQREHLRSARRERIEINRNHPEPSFYRHGIYSVTVNRNSISASTRVTSMLLPTTDAVFDGQHGSRGWLAITLAVPSGEPILLRDLFVRPLAGVQALRRGFRDRLGPERRCLDDGTLELFGPFGRDFALTPTGIAVGVRSDNACGTWYQTVPYARIRKYLSQHGAALVDAIRRPLFPLRHRVESGAAAVSVRSDPDAVELRPEALTVLPRRGVRSFTVNVDSEGIDRRNVGVALVIRRAKTTIVRRAVIPSIAPDHEESRTVPGFVPEPDETAVTLEIVTTSRTKTSEPIADTAVYRIALAPESITGNERDFPRYVLPREGRIGAGVVSVQARPSDWYLRPGRETTITAGSDLAFRVAVQNTGARPIAVLRIRFRIVQSPDPIVRSAVVRNLAPGRITHVDFAHLGELAYVRKTAVVVEVDRQPGEVVTRNNRFAYPVVFSLG